VIQIVHQNKFVLHKTTRDLCHKFKWTMQAHVKLNSRKKRKV
jgi:hypothetical protein